MRELIDFVALDIETTGFDFVENEIIEIGAFRFKNGKPVDEFSIFIKPLKEVPEFIKQLTHITDEQLAGGVSLPDALEEMKKYLKKDIVVCHNAGFDIGFINRKLISCGMEELDNEIMDTLDISRAYLPVTLNHKLGTVAEFFNIDLSNAHRAYFDAKATGEILLNLLDFIDDKIELSTNNFMWEIAEYAELPIREFIRRVIEFQKKNVLIKNKKTGKIDFHNRNYIEHNVIAEDMTVDDVFGTGGIFEDKFDDYELRSGQIEMAEAIEHNFTQREYLLVEAGTGVGKSLAYLLPSIFFTNKNNSKVIISTNTKNLQEQLFYKDLPLIKDCVNVPFKATLLKGRGNYICARKWAEATIDLRRMMSPFEARALLNFVVWKKFTQTGDIAENSCYNSKRDSSAWKKLVADRHFCLGKKCPYNKQCFLMDVRKKAEESNLVIINHYLMLADIQTENGALGEYDHLVIDEAHNLPQLASAELGLSFSYADFVSFFNQVYSTRGKFQTGVLINLKAAVVKSRFEQQEVLNDKIEEAKFLIEENQELFKLFFSQIARVVQDKGSYGKLRVKDSDEHPFLARYIAEVIEFLQNLSGKVMALHNILSGVNSKIFVDYDKNMDAISGTMDRIAEFHDGMTKIYNPDMAKSAYWMEAMQVNDEQYPAGILNLAPLDVNEILNEMLYEKVKSIVFTSATMAIRGKFKYFASRMGLDLLEPGFLREIIVESPFDYLAQTKVIVGGFLPEPRDKFFANQSLSLIRDAVKISKAGTMILFTSYKDLNTCYENLNSEFYAQDIPFLAQGKGISRSAMLREFKEKKNAVLLGTNSFWEGVDVRGESLSLLVLYKIPFMVPSDPIVEAYLEKLEAEGKNSFMHYMMPNALLRYRQGFGRLIRHKSDRGIVLVLDNRIATKRYGKYFCETVPAKTYFPKSAIELHDMLANWFR